MKVGVILTGYNMAEYVRPCLDAWIAARVRALGGHTFLICAVSVPFAGFPNDHEDDTVPLLRGELEDGHIDHLITEPKHIPETTARSMALTWLAAQGADVLWQVDMDEFITLDQIAYILKTIEMPGNEWVEWYRLSYKNYIFDDKTYLVDLFQPPRIHRVKSIRYPNLRAHCFIADNDIGYQDKNEPNGTIWPQSSLASGTIVPVGPNAQASAPIRHMTWQNSPRSKHKISYQLDSRRWPTCSFSWDDAKGLIFNPALPAPQVARDE